MSAAAANDARSLEQTYLSPEITHQRFRTLQALGVRPGDRILDAGCGPGLLTAELARLSGESGQVLAVDKNGDMLALARERCARLPQVSFREGPIESFESDEAAFDAIACTQVLLYIEDVPRVLAALHRLLRRGGRMVVVETDWRGCVVSSEDFDLTEEVIRAWDDAVPSPNLPVRLAPMLRSAGFNAVRIEPIPILDTSLLPGGCSQSMIDVFIHKAVGQGRVEESRAREWREALHGQAQRGAYFFCVNRFLFSAVK